MSSDGTTIKQFHVSSSWHLWFAVVFVTGCAACTHVGSGCTKASTAMWPVPDSWLVEQVTLGEAERANMIDGVAFGRMNEAWLRLRSNYREGDQLWRYDSPHMWGTGGFLLLRDCKAIDQLVTIQYE